MIILENAQSIMYLSIALGILMIASLITWMLFYFVMIIRDARTIITKAKDTLATTHELVKSVKHKIDETSIHFKFLLEGMKNIMEWIQDKQEEKAKTATKISSQQK